MDGFERQVLGDGAREWWPASLLPDEADGRAWPLDWVVTDRYRRFHLDLPGGPTERRGLRIGEELPFRWRECRAFMEATIGPDGLFEPHGSPPRDATHFWIAGDPGLIADTLDDLAGMVGSQLRRPARFSIRMCRWSPRPVLMRLHLRGGRPVLVPASLAA